MGGQHRFGPRGTSELSSRLAPWRASAARCFSQRPRRSLRATRPRRSAEEMSASSLPLNTFGMALGPALADSSRSASAGLGCSSRQGHSPSPSPCSAPLIPRDPATVPVVRPRRAATFWPVSRSCCSREPGRLVGVDVSAHDRLRRSVPRGAAAFVRIECALDPMLDFGCSAQRDLCRGDGGAA